MADKEIVKEKYADRYRAAKHLRTSGVITLGTFLLMASMVLLAPGNPFGIAEIVLLVVLIVAGFVSMRVFAALAALLDNVTDRAVASSAFLTDVERFEIMVAESRMAGSFGIAEAGESHPQVCELAAPSFREFYSPVTALVDSAPWGAQAHSERYLPRVLRRRMR